MKNAKDYIEETSPNIRTITSLAYWLTPEGMDNPIYAALLRKTISRATDEEFKEAFDGATKAEAALHLERWELCYMGQWGAPELAKAIVLSDAGRNEALALRAVSMAQGAKELPEVFSPKVGIQWAMARGYLIGSIGAWCGVKPGNYGHPSNPLSPADAPKVAKGKAGRPRTIDKKVIAVRDMIERFERAASIQFTPQALRGSAADLLDACQRFEKSNKTPPLKFSTSQETFNVWLKSAGYSFPTGRTPDIEKNYWTQLVVKVRD